MTLHPRNWSSIPEMTASVARTSFPKEWQFNNLSNVDLSILASKAGGREDAEIIEFLFLKETHI